MGVVIEGIRVSDKQLTRRAPRSLCETENCRHCITLQQEAVLRSHGQTNES
jgi:hypothetical protein